MLHQLILTIVILLCTGLALNYLPIFGNLFVQRSIQAIIVIISIVGILSVWNLQF